MRVLDLDLDFFLKNIAFNDSTLRRMSDDGRYEPDPEETVRAFLEERCRLSVDRPTPGAVVTHHDEAFGLWRSLIESGRLDSPFDIVHVDAHADLGFGDDGWMYLMAELLHRPVEGRLHPVVDANDGLNEGNYLLFALAARWVRPLTYVHHRSRKPNDVMGLIMKDDDLDSGALQLKGYTRQQLGELYTGRVTPTVIEPAVPFGVVPPETFRADEPFDLVILACSPRYTPPSADRLVPVIQEYIAPFAGEG